MLGDAGWRREESLNGYRWLSKDWARYPSEGHLCTVAKTGAGKFRRVIKPNLLTMPNSVIVIDNKGETAEQTLRHRMEVLGHKVFLFDPYHAVPDAALPDGFKRSSFNPVDFIRTSDLSPFESALTIAQSFIKPSPKDPRWGQAAQLWLAAHLIHVAFDPSFDADPDLRTFETAWQYATRPDLKDLSLAQMETSSDSFVAAQARTIRDGRGKTGGETDSIEREFFIQCAKLASSPELQAAMRTSDLDFGRLRDEPITVYVVLPLRVAEAQAGFFSMFLCCALDQIMARGIERHGSDGKKRLPVYFEMDEFLTQGRMERFLRAFREIRGFNVVLHAYVQDLGALKAVYGDEWSTIIGNCGVIQYFGGTADLFTQEYFSKLTGQATLNNVSTNASTTIGSSSGRSGGSSYGSGSSSTFGSTSGLSSGPGGGSVSSSTQSSYGSNLSSNTSSGWNENKNFSSTSGVTQSFVAGTLKTPEEIGNLPLPEQILWFPGTGCTQVILLPDALIDFETGTDPGTLVRRQAESFRFRPCRTVGCLGKVMIPYFFLVPTYGIPKQWLTRELITCPVCNGGSDTLCEHIVFAIETAQPLPDGSGRLHPDPKGAAYMLETFVRSADEYYPRLGVLRGAYDHLRNMTDRCSRSDPQWRRLLDPFQVSGRYPEIFSRLAFDYKDRNTSWTLLDDAHPNRDLRANPYFDEHTRKFLADMDHNVRMAGRNSPFYDEQARDFAEIMGPADRQRTDRQRTLSVRSQSAAAPIKPGKPKAIALSGTVAIIGYIVLATLHLTGPASLILLLVICFGVYKGVNR